jgi:hypothetical protein
MNEPYLLRSIRRDKGRKTKKEKPERKKNEKTTDGNNMSSLTSGWTALFQH